jgi:hypothetical protein
VIAETLFTEKKPELSSQIRSFNEIDSRLREIYPKPYILWRIGGFLKNRAFQK